MFQIHFFFFLFPPNINIKKCFLGEDSYRKYFLWFVSEETMSLATRLGLLLHCLLFVPQPQCTTNQTLHLKKQNDEKSSTNDKQK